MEWMGRAQRTCLVVQHQFRLGVVAALRAAGSSCLRAASHPPPVLPRRVPPKLRLVPLRPIVLDAALNYIQYPSLEHRLPQKAPAAAAQQQGGGMVSRLFGWGR